MSDRLPLPSLSTDTRGLQKGDSRHLRENIRELFSGDRADSEFLDVTITSPPYADMVEYDADSGTQIGFGDQYDDYLKDLRQVFRQTYDITKSGGSLWVVVNSFRREGHFIDLPGDIAQICQNITDAQICPHCSAELETQFQSAAPTCPDCGYQTINDSWRHHDTIIWDKERARPYSHETFRNTFEYILCFTKSGDPHFDFDKVRIADERELQQWWVDWPERYHPRGKIPDNIWTMVTPTQGGWNEEWPGHPAPFPPELVERLVRLTTDEDGVVFDPFGGSGTTVAQAILMGRQAFGFEISEQYLNNYDRVFEYLQEMWAERRAENETVKLQQDRLERTIWGLRQLTYAKKAATKLLKDTRDDDPAVDSLDALGLHSILVDSALPDPSEATDPVESMETEFTFVFDADTGQQYLSQLQALPDEDPWNGFEIEPTIQTMSVHAVDYTQLPSDNGGPYLYMNGEHAKAARRLPKHAWADAVTDPTRWRSRTASTFCPALVSNLFVSVERSDSGPELSDAILGEPPSSDQKTGTARIADTAAHIDTSLADFS